MTRHYRHTKFVVRLPERDLSDVILELAAPLLDRLGPAVTVEDTRATIATTVSFWNASVLASKLWPGSRTTDLRALTKQMRGRAASRENASAFDMLSAGRRAHWLDPRLVVSWAYEPDAGGAPRLTCEVRLPLGVEAEVPPPIEKRISIGGRFLDEVRVPRGGNAFLSFPVERHRGVVNEDGSATVLAMMPTTLQLFAEGRLPPVDGASVDVNIGGRELGPMVLVEVRCVHDNYRDEVAMLVFRPSGTAAPGT